MITLTDNNSKWADNVACSRVGGFLPRLDALGRAAQGWEQDPRQFAKYCKRVPVAMQLVIPAGSPLYVRFCRFHGVPAMLACVLTVDRRWTHSAGENVANILLHPPRGVIARGPALNGVGHRRVTCAC